MHFNSSPRLGLLFIAISAVLWGTVGIATQAIFHQSALNAVAVGFFRLAFAFPVVALLCWAMVGKKIFAVAWRYYLKMAVIGAMLAIYQVFYFSSVGRIGVALATLITLCTAPVLVALASVVFLREPLTRPTLHALFCALAGTILLVGFPENQIARGNIMPGTLFALGSAAGYALVALLGRSIAANCHPLHSTTVSFGVGALFLLPLAAANVVSVQFTTATLSLLCYIGVVPTAVAYSLFFLGVRHVKASTAAILTMLEPLTATILAWFIFGERLAMAGFAGAGLLLLALVVLYRGERPGSG